jgi:hypothetical protein
MATPWNPVQIPPLPRTLQPPQYAPQPWADQEPSHCASRCPWHAWPCKNSMILRSSGQQPEARHPISSSSHSLSTQ